MKLLLASYVIFAKSQIEPKHVYDSGTIIVPIHRRRKLCYFSFARCRISFQMEAIKEIYLVNLSNFWKVKYWMGFVVKKHSLKSFRSRVYTVAIAILTFNNAITTMTSKKENYIGVWGRCP